MTVTALGSMQVSAAVPGAAAAVSAGVDGIRGGMPDIEARIAAIAAFVPRPISLDAQLSLALDILNGVTLAQSFGLQPPSLDAQIAQAAALLAELRLQLVTVQANLDVCLALHGALAGGSIGVYVFDGALGSFGAELGAAIGASGAHANAIALVATDSASWAALTQIVRAT